MLTPSGDDPSSGYPRLRKSLALQPHNPDWILPMGPPLFPLSSGTEDPERSSKGIFGFLQFNVKAPSAPTPLGSSPSKPTESPLKVSKPTPLHCTAASQPLWRTSKEAAIPVPVPPDPVGYSQSRSTKSGSSSWWSGVRWKSCESESILPPFNAYLNKEKIVEANCFRSSSPSDSLLSNPNVSKKKYFEFTGSAAKSSPHLASATHAAPDVLKASSVPFAVSTTSGAAGPSTQPMPAPVGEQLSSFSSPVWRTDNATEKVNVQSSPSTFCQVAAQHHDPLSAVGILNPSSCSDVTKEEVSAEPNIPIFSTMIPEAKGCGVLAKEEEEEGLEQLRSLLESALLSGEEVPAPVTTPTPYAPFSGSPTLSFTFKAPKPFFPAKGNSAGGFSPAFI